MTYRAAPLGRPLRVAELLSARGAVFYRDVDCDHGRGRRLLDLVRGRRHGRTHTQELVRLALDDADTLVVRLLPDDRVELI